MVLGQIIYTPGEIQARLERYNEDDSLYDIHNPVASQLRSGNSSQNDPMVSIGYRLCKRAELDRAISALGRVHKYYIRFRYIHGEPVDVIAFISKNSDDYIKAYIGEAIVIMTNWLNDETIKQYKVARQKEKALK